MKNRSVHNERQYYVESVKYINGRKIVKFIHDNKAEIPLIYYKQIRWMTGTDKDLGFSY